MASASDTYFRKQLALRRQQLQAATSRNGETAEIQRLMADVDAALMRLDAGSFGICQVCKGDIELDRLIADPLARTCADETGAGLADFAPEDLQRLEADLEMAGRIQRALLPPEKLTVHGWDMQYYYEPLGPVSGDYCDLIVPSPPARELFFLLGDVSGKGVAASLLMSQLHAMFRSLVTVGQPLGQALALANRLFCERPIAGQYATLVAGCADCQGHVELAGAGHPPTLLLGNGGVTRIESTGFPLGMFSDAHFTTQQFDLRPGDSLLFYSDGVTESRGESGEEYGVERLARFAEKRRSSPPAELVASCLAELHDFSAAQPRSDDVTLMALRRAA